MRVQTILTTRRLRLRTWRAGDDAAYNRHCNTEEVMKHLGGALGPRQLKREVAWFIAHQKREGISFWVLERKRDKALLGFCGLIRVRETSSPLLGEIEVGWRIRADMWRRGYAYEAAQAVLAYGFDRLGVERIVARVVPENTASRGVMHKLGMARRPELDYLDPHDQTPLIVYAKPRPLLG